VPPLNNLGPGIAPIAGMQMLAGYLCEGCGSSSTVKKQGKDCRDQCGGASNAVNAMYHRISLPNNSLVKRLIKVRYVDTIGETQTSAAKNLGTILSRNQLAVIADSIIETMGTGNVFFDSNLSGIM